MRSFARSASIPSARRSNTNKNAPCGSLDCAGCYDARDGVKFHPPKAGSGYVAWKKRWNEAARLRASHGQQRVSENETKRELQEFHRDYLAKNPEARAPDAEPRKPDFKLKPKGICWHCAGTRKCNCIGCDKGVCAVCS
jgi:hypothetical protein